MACYTACRRGTVYCLLFLLQGRFQRLIPRNNSKFLRVISSDAVPDAGFVR